MNNSYESKPTTEKIHENLNNSTTTSKSSLSNEKKKFSVNKEKSYNQQELLQNKILRNGKFK